MGFITDMMKNDTIEEKKFINDMIRDNVPMSHIKKVTERSKREIEAILAFPDDPTPKDIRAINYIWHKGAIRRYKEELKEREKVYKADIEEFRKEGRSWKEIFEILKFRMRFDPVIAECNIIVWISDCQEKE